MNRELIGEILVWYQTTFEALDERAKQRSHLLGSALCCTVRSLVDLPANDKVVLQRDPSHGTPCDLPEEQSSRDKEVKAFMLSVKQNKEAAQSTTAAREEEDNRRSKHRSEGPPGHRGVASRRPAPPRRAWGEGPPSEYKVPRSAKDQPWPRGRVPDEPRRFFPSRARDGFRARSGSARPSDPRVPTARPSKDEFPKKFDFDFRDRGHPPSESKEHAVVRAVAPPLARPPEASRAPVGPTKVDPQLIVSESTGSLDRARDFAVSMTSITSSLSLEKSFVEHYVNIDGLAPQPLPLHVKLLLFHVGVKFSWIPCNIVRWAAFMTGIKIEACDAVNMSIAVNNHITASASSQIPQVSTPTCKRVRTDSPHGQLNPHPARLTLLSPFGGSVAITCPVDNRKSTNSVDRELATGHLTSPPHNLQPGGHHPREETQHIGDFCKIGLIGQGGYGEVHLALSMRARPHKSLRPTLIDFIHLSVERRVRAAGTASPKRTARRAKAPFEAPSLDKRPMPLSFVDVSTHGSALQDKPSPDIPVRKRINRSTSSTLPAPQRPEAKAAAPRAKVVRRVSKTDDCSSITADDGSSVTAAKRTRRRVKSSSTLVRKLPANSERVETEGAPSVSTASLSSSQVGARGPGRSGANSRAASLDVKSPDRITADPAKKITKRKKKGIPPALKLPTPPTSTNATHPLPTHPGVAPGPVAVRPQTWPSESEDEGGSKVVSVRRRKTVVPPAKKVSRSSPTKHIIKNVHFDNVTLIPLRPYWWRGCYADEDPSRIVALKRFLAGIDVDGITKSTIRELSIGNSLRHCNVISVVAAVCSSTSRGEVVPSVANKSIAQSSESAKRSIWFSMNFHPIDLDRLVKYRRQKLMRGLTPHSAVNGEYNTDIFKLSEIRLVVKDLLEALVFAHDRDLIHRDLKEANVMVTEEGKAKLVDFGLARLSGTRSTLSNKVVTLWYRSPELLLGATDYGPEVDMWSLGVVIFNLLVSDVVIKGDNEMLMLQCLVDNIPLPKYDHWSLQERERYPLWRQANYHIDGLVADGDDAKSRGAVLGKPSWQKVIGRFRHEDLACAKELRSTFMGSDLEETTFVHWPIKELGMNFLLGLLDWNPCTRLTAKEALGHPWLTVGHTEESLQIGECIKDTKFKSRPTPTANSAQENCNTTKSSSDILEMIVEQEEEKLESGKNTLKQLQLEYEKLLSEKKNKESEPVAKT
eukprot:GHVH01006442.1.p1 GENE.GHVH01006442.1~~GHVH01006442.1.p1  ORF type:complete len:1208 (+),score=191.69 GHVH01006442.1:47-3670(+)